MSKEIIREKIGHIESLINCVYGLASPLIPNAFESTLQGVLNDIPPYLGSSPRCNQKDNALDWMIDHYEQVSGVISAIYLMTHQAQQALDELSATMYHVDIVEKTA